MLTLINSMQSSQNLQKLFKGRMKKGEVSVLSGELLTCERGSRTCHKYLLASLEPAAQNAETLFLLHKSPWIFIFLIITIIIIIVKFFN